MIKLQILIAVFLIIGILFFLWEPKKVGSYFSLSKASAKTKRAKINAENTLNWFDKIVLHIDDLLKMLNKTRKHFYIVSFVCFVGGCYLGKMCFGDNFLTFSMGFTCMPLSYLYLLFRTQEKTRDELAELQNAMSIITNSYLASENLVKAVEEYIKERQLYSDGSIVESGPFEEFVADCLYINANINSNLRNLARKLNNYYFDQWCKNLMQCIENKQMRFSLQPVIDAMADEKIMQIESDAQVRATWGRYLLIVGVMFATIPTFKIAREEWYLTLTTTPIGKGIIFCMLVAAIISAIYVMKINKPIGTI